MVPHKRTTLPLLSCVILLAGCGAQEPEKTAPPEVGVVTLKSEPAVLMSELPGRVTAVETSEVRPQISGVIRRRLFEEGAIVHAGQVLYAIEDAPYRAALGTAQGSLARAQAAIDATRLQAERYRGLVNINAVSRQEADNADAAARQARADVSAQRAAVDAAQVNLGFTQIRAPISGRIGRSRFTPGALVQAGQPDPLAIIQQTDRVYVDVTQSAAEILELKEAMKAGGVVRDDGSARVALVLPNGKTYPVEGRLQFSEVTVDQTTGAVTLRASFPNADGMLLPGMYVRARLIDGVRQNAILAPQRGIARNERGEPTALIVNRDNKVEQRIVATDRALGDRWVITSGLKPGDRLIVDGLLKAKPGSSVTPRAPVSGNSQLAGK
ncbi:efflux RND transporter periplasmic adaptor subunit [Sphingobium baderi]|uniref:Hemolysin D n=1 Tax=Sphingobium baderi TaxID=1332080 RepID=A0A0S3EXK3_9SPHN|nr:efflux RND transporter periplasmic adaptor subunit [Sphingobium baderi]ALR20172.1 hemolysin D [Sphingobium baderi]